MADSAREELTNGNPNCPHEKIDLVGGMGDERGIWDIFQCRKCGWKFTIESVEE